MVMINIKGKEFSMDGFLKQKLDNVKYIVQEKDFDCVIIVDGMERIGKSTLGITCGYYLTDGNFSVDNICTSSDDTIKKMETCPDKSCLVLDESILIFSSRDSMKKEQKKIIKIMNVVGQKNMVFIVILPSIFDLNRQIAVRRSRFLLHCYTDGKLTRGRFAYFGENKKKRLYEIGKKNFDSYRKPRADFVGRFTKFNPLGKEYIKTKMKSLLASLHEGNEKSVSEMRIDLRRKIVLNVEKYKFAFKMLQKDKAEMIGVPYRTYKTDISALKGGCMLKC